MPKMTIAEIEALMDQGFPDWRSFSRITDLGERTLTLMMPFRSCSVRVARSRVPR